MAKNKEINISSRQIADAYRNDQIKLENLQKRASDLGAVLNEMSFASESLKELQKTNIDDSLLVSLGAGIYTSAKIANTKTVKVSLSGNVLLDEKIEKTVERIGEEIVRAKKDLDGFTMEIQKTIQNLQGLAEIMQRTRDAQIKQGKEKSDLSSVS